MDDDALSELAPMSELRRVLRGTGLDRRDEFGVPAGLPRPRTLPRLPVRATGVTVPLPPPPPAPAAAEAGPAPVPAAPMRRTRTQIQPSHVAAYTSRSRSSRRRSNALRYRSYASRKERSTRLEKMSSPRGFDDGGIGAMGTDELRFAAPPARRGGDGERRRASRFAAGGGGGDEGAGRGKRSANGLKGSLERSGGCRTLRYMFRLRNARFACGTYLRTPR